MDVFVIPVGPDRYELYYERPAGEDEPIDPQSSGFIGKLRGKLRDFIRAAEERERADPSEQPVPTSWAGRLQDRGMAWVAERIAEQRLLWNLRGQSAVTAAHPGDMLFPQVHALILETLQRDYERHRKWVVIDGLLFVVTFVALGPLFILIPGVANLPALYFGFRTVGHFLSMRGAVYGLRRASWSGRPCPPLDELRGLAGLDPETREARLHDIAVRVRLEHLPKFFERVNRYNSRP